MCTRPTKKHDTGCRILCKCRILFYVAKKPGYNAAIWQLNASVWKAAIPTEPALSCCCCCVWFVLLARFIRPHKARQRPDGVNISKIQNIGYLRTHLARCEHIQCCRLRPYRLWVHRLAGSNAVPCKQLPGATLAEKGRADKISHVKGGINLTINPPGGSHDTRHCP